MYLLVVPVYLGINFFFLRFYGWRWPGAVSLEILGRERQKRRKRELKNTRRLKCRSCLNFSRQWFYESLMKQQTY